VPNAQIAHIDTDPGMPRAQKACLDTACWDTPILHANQAHDRHTRRDKWHGFSVRCKEAD